MIRRPRVLLASAVAAAVLGAGGGLGAAIVGHPAHPGVARRSAARVVAPRAGPAGHGTPTTRPDGVWFPVSPATTVPPDTPVQAHYDHGSESGFSSPTNRAQLAELRSLRLPPPGIGGGWSSLAVANTPEGWARAFVKGLLSIDFASRSRAALGPWLVAQEAPDLMPGIPPGARDAALYASLLRPDVTGQPSPIPSPTGWKADARAKVSWSPRQLQVGIDPAWSSMISAGWQPVDLRADVLDVSGLLRVNHGASVSLHRFSLVLQVGSAHWHPGYGSVLLSAWSES